MLRVSNQHCWRAIIQRHGYCSVHAREAEQARQGATAKEVSMSLDSTMSASHEASQLDRRLNDIGWGLLFMLTGFVWLVPTEQVPPGAWLFGVAAVLIGTNIVTVREAGPHQRLLARPRLPGTPRRIGTALACRLAAAGDVPAPHRRKPGRQATADANHIGRSRFAGLDGAYALGLRTGNVTTAGRDVRAVQVIVSPLQASCPTGSGDHRGEGQEHTGIDSCSSASAVRGGGFPAAVAVSLTAKRQLPSRGSAAVRITARVRRIANRAT